MYSKNKIKRKAIVLTTCSILGVNLMVNKDSAQAMKKLKAIGNSIKKAVTQEDKKRMQQQQQLENEIARLMHNKLHRNNLTKEQETKLVSNIEIVKISNGNVKSKYNNEKIKIVNPVSILITHYNKEDKFVSLLEWINLHIPEAFNIDNITTALFEAIKEGDASYTKDKKLKKQKAIAMCKHLLVYNPDLTQKRKCRIKIESYTFTALEYAQAVGLPEVVEMILDKSGDKQYLLYNAICSGNLEEVKKAISEGANINELVHGTDLENYNPVYLALIKKDIAMADFLIQNGSKVPKLDVALINRSAEMFDYLIQKGAKLSENASPIELIFKDFGNQKWSFWKDQNNIKFLEKMIQDERINITWKEDYNEFFNRTLMYTSKVIRDFYFEHCEEVPDSALVDVCSSDDIPESQKIEIVEFLLNKGCNSIDGSGLCSRPIRYACEHHQFDLAKLLIKHGAKLGILSEDSYSVLSYTISDSLVTCRGLDLRPDKAWVEFIKFLVNDCKVSANGPHFHGQGLIFAFLKYIVHEGDKLTETEINNMLEVANFLIQKGMNVNAVNNRGETLLEEINRYRYTTVGMVLIDLFVQNGAKRYLD